MSARVTSGMFLVVARAGISEAEVAGRSGICGLGPARRDSSVSISREIRKIVAEYQDDESSRVAELTMNYEIAGGRSEMNKSHAGQVLTAPGAVLMGQRSSPFGSVSGKDEPGEMLFASSHLSRGTFPASIRFQKLIRVFPSCRHHVVAASNQQLPSR